MLTKRIIITLAALAAFFFAPAQANEVQGAFFIDFRICGESFYIVARDNDDAFVLGETSALTQIAEARVAIIKALGEATVNKKVAIIRAEKYAGIRCGRA